MDIQLYPSGKISLFLKKQVFILLLISLYWTISLKGQSNSLFTPGYSFKQDSKIVSTSFFHWYASNGGQLSGPWMPLEGRENWTGLTDWWKTQIKQTMMANIDVLNVHLIDDAEIRRILMFRALYELRAEGYDVPKILPFLDPLITWYEEPKVDLATTAGKDSLASQYIRFYNQYFNENPDEFAGEYLARMDGRPMLDTWHVFLNFENVEDLSREDLTNRFKSALADKHETFNEDIYMISTALNPPFYSFTDEKIAQFEINEYLYEVEFNGINTAQMKAGYWDQNVRTPGSFLPRDGGIHYKEAWDNLSEDIDRVYIESWNEYDEGTGIYAGDVGAPYLKPGSENTNTDVWSATNDPYEYIHTTAAGAARFNDRPELDTKVLANSLPTIMTGGETIEASITIRNEGNASWTGADGFKLVQLSTDEVVFATSDALIDDNSNEIPIYGGIFRGRPITFAVSLEAPAEAGTYETHWQMTKEGEAFGEVLTVVIEVQVLSSANEVTGQELEVQIFPNPTFGDLILKWKESIPTANFRVLDVFGRAVMPSQKISNGTRLAIDLPAGIYQVLLEMDGKRYTERVSVN